MQSLRSSCSGHGLASTACAGVRADAAAGFIAHTGILTIFSDGAGDQRIHLAQYDRRLYEPQQCEQLGITMPPDVARSVKSRQADFLAGRVAARCALTELGETNVVVGIGRQREPFWPAGVVGSISHNGWIAAAAVTRRARLGIGIDIEDIVADDALTAIMDVAVSAGERRSLNRYLDEVPLAWLATLVFSAKESFFKAAFASVREIFDFDAVEILGLHRNVQRLTLATTRRLSAELPAGLVFDAGYRQLDARALVTCVTLG